MGNAAKLHIVGSQKAKIWSLSPCCAALTGAIPYPNKNNQKQSETSGIIWHHLASSGKPPYRSIFMHVHRNIRTHIRTYQDNDDSVRHSATIPSGSTGDNKTETWRKKVHHFLRISVGLFHMQYMQLSSYRITRYADWAFSCLLHRAETCFRARTSCKLGL